MQCLNPIFLPDKSLSGHPRFSTEGRPSHFVVPCGKCPSCLKRRQQDLACRVARCASEYGSMIFVTFTYRPENLPVACTLEKVDIDTGEVFVDYKTCLLEDSPLLEHCREVFSTMPSSSEPKYYVRSDVFPSFDDRYQYRYCFTPSLSRLNFRLWLKNARVKYEREKGVKLPKFSYVAVGEYGCKSCRPHMHACFMGLTYSQVCDMCASWKEKYGFVYVLKVNAVNRDSSSGFLKASLYIGKYISKGFFDCESVKCGYAEKPRICASHHLGTDLSQEEIFYYSAYDLFGIYDPERLCFLNGLKLSPGQIQSIQEQIFKRSFIVVDGHKFLLPSAIRKRIFTRVITYEQNGKVVGRKVESYKICRLAANASSCRFFDDLNQRKEQITRGLTFREGAVKLREFFTYSSDCIKAKLASSEAVFVKQYSRSKF